MLLIAIYILNRVSSKSVPFTPYELWANSKSNPGHLRPCGSASYVYTTSHPNGKLGLRGKNCIFSKGYVLLGEHKYGTITEIDSQDANFLEEEFLKKVK